MRTPFLSFTRKGRPPAEPQVFSASAADNLRGSGLMMLSVAGFTCNDALMKAATQSLPLYESITIRGGLVLLVMVLIARARGGLQLRLARADAGRLLLRTGADVVSTVLYLLALRRMPLADVSAIMQSLPLAMTLAAALFFGERLGWRRLLAIGAGFAGVLLILRPGTGAFDQWSALVLAAMLLIVLRDLVTRTFSAQVGSSGIAFYAGFAVMMAGAVLGLTETWRLPSPAEMGLLTLAALFLTLGYVTAVSSMRVGEISVVAPFRYTSLIWAVLLGLAMFGEWPDAWTWAGAALVVGAGIYTILRERQLGRAR
ncbi:Permease of the drug/metabolite transporter (DMT) superfamily [Paracoccus thiocyanatus]|uniref:Permease of the drug/metabolite transporter (DMT) superfamily n=1 Tax=Paracoccus thiocyanatus TaxID=34006 RepID=A0A1N6ZHE7_9RHOB|nr:DMT family transporter [Paracoccus thiocyanatus]SIR26228.1 Permease of the drug/metabolite transporter (DMT) superfamily [Paracoccus thiocyanatus]